MTATVKNHTLKFGFDQFNIRENDQQSGAYDTDDGNRNTGEPSHPSGCSLQPPLSRTLQWRLCAGRLENPPRPTIDAGVRYDQMSNFFSILSPKLTNFTLGSGWTFNDQIAGGIAGFTPNAHVLDHNLWGLTPRIGFSWDAAGNGRTAIRGGVGMFSDQPPYIHITDITAGNLPNAYTPSVSVYCGQTPNFQLCSAPTGFTISCPGRGHNPRCTESRWRHRWSTSGSWWLHP